jgi:tRNA(Ile)-lysidine synthase
MNRGRPVRGEDLWWIRPGTRGGTDAAGSRIGELLSRCTFPPAGASAVCALSGGADSAAMTVLAVAAGCDATAVHIDHGLRDDSGRDAIVAATLADRLGIPIRVERADIPEGPNLEARARAARRSMLGPEALTGHTVDDQAETVLLALIRGSGARGLAAMAPTGHPILRLRRSETRELCALLGIHVARDPSNEDRRFWRNRVRGEVLPLLGDIADRDVAPLLVRTAALLREDDEVLCRLAAELDPTDAGALRDAPPPLARRAVRAWLTADGYPPDAAAIERVLEVARGVRVACEVSGGRRVHRRNQRLSVFANRPGPE